MEGLMYRQYFFLFLGPFVWVLSYPFQKWSQVFYQWDRPSVYLFDELHLQGCYYTSLSDNQSPLVSRTLLSILADFSNSVVWIVSILPMIYSSSSLFSRFWGIVSRAKSIIGITITFVFHRLFSSLARSMYLYSFIVIYSMLVFTSAISGSFHWSPSDSKSCQAVESYIVIYFAHKINIWVLDRTPPKTNNPTKKQKRNKRKNKTNKQTKVLLIKPITN